MVWAYLPCNLIKILNSKNTVRVLFVKYLFLKSLSLHLFIYVEVIYIYVCVFVYVCIPFLYKWKHTIYTLFYTLLFSLSKYILGTVPYQHIEINLFVSIWNFLPLTFAMANDDGTLNISFFKHHVRVI